MGLDINENLHTALFQPPHFQKMLEYVGSMKQYHIATTRSPVLTEIILKFSNIDITELATSVALSHLALYYEI